MTYSNYMFLVLDNNGRKLFKIIKSAAIKGRGHSSQTE